VPISFERPGFGRGQISITTGEHPGGLLGGGIGFGPIEVGLDPCGSG